MHERVCHHWVEAVEAGGLGDPGVADLVKAELLPLQRAGGDTYVLGCIHFPVLVPTIRRLVSEATALVDPGPAVVDQLCRRLDLAGTTATPSALRVFTSGPPSRFREQLRHLMGLSVDCDPLPLPAQDDLSRS